MSFPMHFRATSMPGSFSRVTACWWEENALIRRLKQHNDNCTQRNCTFAYLEDILVQGIAEAALENIFVDKSR